MNLKEPFYIKFSDEAVYQTDEYQGVNIDIDENGEVVGIVVFAPCELEGDEIEAKGGM